MSQHFDIRQRIGENRIGRPAVDPESLLVRGDTDAVGVAFAALPAPNPVGSSGALILATSARLAKSTTEKLFRAPRFTKIRRPEPSGIISIAIGFTPLSY